MGIFNWAWSLLKGKPKASGGRVDEIAEPIETNFIEIREDAFRHLAEILSKKQITAILFYKRDCPFCKGAISAFRELSGVCKRVMFCMHRTSSSGLFAEKFAIFKVPLMIVFRWDSDNDCQRAVSYTLGFGRKEAAREEYTKRIGDALRGKSQHMRLHIYNFDDVQNFQIIMPDPRAEYYGM